MRKMYQLYVEDNSGAIFSQHFDSLEEANSHFDELCDSGCNYVELSELFIYPDNSVEDCGVLWFYVREVDAVDVIAV